MLPSDSKRGEKRVQLRAAERAMFPGLESAEMNVHDAHSFQLHCALPERAAHAAYLVLLSLGDGDREFFRVAHAYLAGLCAIAADVDASLHGSLERRRRRRERDDLIFFFVRMLRIKKCLGQAPVVSQDDESVRILIQTPDGEYARDWKDVFDLLLFALRRMRDHAAWFVVGDIAAFPRAEPSFYLVVGVYAIAQCCARAVDRHEAFLDKLIGLAARAKLLMREVFIDSHRICLVPCVFHIVGISAATAVFK